MLAQALDTRATLEFAADVRRDLSKTPQRELHSKYLYDDVGSALFEAITLLPEYGLTRADERLLRAHAGDIVRHACRRLRSSPNSAAAAARRRAGSWKRWRGGTYVLYYPIDVSAAALHACRNEMGTIDSVHIVEIESTYTDGLKEVTARRSPGESLLVLFLGSTIGNFERGPGAEFPARDPRAASARRRAAAGHGSGQAVVAGAPRLRRSHRRDGRIQSEPAGAHQSRAGRAISTCAQFRHEARYNEAERRIEMHLRSRDRADRAHPRRGFPGHAAGRRNHLD